MNATKCKSVALDKLIEGHVYYDLKSDEVVLVRGFSKDHMGQSAVLFANTEVDSEGSICLMATAWIALERWTHLGPL